MKRIGLIVIVLLSLSLFVHTAEAASTPPPDVDDKTVYGSLTGAAISPGWNYLKLGATSCSAGTIFDELQADAGGGVRIDSLWVGSGTTLLSGQTWKEYASADTTAIKSVIPAGSKLALYTASRFYIDFNESTCSKERTVKQKTQIDQARAVAVQNVAPIDPPKQNVSLTTKITAPAGRIFTWLVNTWTNGISMVWSQVTGLFGLGSKK
ncbi:MAG: hypothetical protein Q8L37_02700 [Candidatus Gottesmanbacteria bacterium]|nr:hypothetical protein [Candidatus Gottesmanbacteria bacterium]